MKIVIPETALIIAVSLVLHQMLQGHLMILFLGAGISLAGFIVLLKVSHRQITLRRKG